MRGLFLVLIVSAMLGGCSGCNEEGGSRPITDNTSVVSGDVVVNKDQLELLERNLKDYLLAPEEGRFRDLMDWSHPNFVTSEAQYKVSLESMQDFYDRGVRNDMQEWSINQIYPLLDIDSMWVCLVKFNIHNKVNILEHFDGLASNYVGPLKEQFSFAEVSYDEANRQYTIIGNDYIYAFFEKENDNMYFTSTAFVQSAKIYSMIDQETLLMLRSYQY
jgi:hypothetical protein